jgi:hypothetical protein
MTLATTRDWGLGIRRVRRVKPALIGALVITVLMTTLHLLSLDGLDGWLLATFYEDDTEYANGYSEAGFKNVRIGSSAAEVIALLGPHLGEAWGFEASDREYAQVSLDRDSRVEYVWPRGRIRIGISIGELHSLMGPPDLKILSYTRSPNDRSYRVRVIHMRQGRVSEKLHHYYLD